MNRSRRYRRSGGFTLLEVILALSLAVVLIGLIGSAVRIYHSVADESQSAVREAQLAHRALDLIAIDLQSAVRSELQDTSSLKDLAGAPDTEDLENLEDLDDLDDLEGEDGEEEPAATLAESAEPPPRPGIYGNQYELQIDVGRLPRLDQLDPAYTAGMTQSQSPAADIKSVSYYVRLAQDIGPVAGNPAAGNPLAGDYAAGGLVRRSLDRAAALWAAENGNYEVLEGGDRLLAAEIVAAEFRYYDGYQWHFEWDSDQRGGLPLAVEIAIAIVRPRHDEPATDVSPTLLLDGDGSSEWTVYRRVVHLPIARPLDADDMRENEAEDDQEQADVETPDAAGQADLAPPGGASAKP